MKRNACITLLVTLCLASFPLTALADTLNSSNLLAMAQSDESLIAKNPTNANLYQNLGQVYQQENDTSLHIFVNGGKLDFDVAPYITEGRILTPVRSIAESLGFTVKWDPNTEQVTLSNSQHSIVLTIHSTKANVDGSIDTLDVPATIVDNRTFVPLRFVSEALQANVSWYPTGKVVSINTPSVPTQQTTGTAGTSTQENTIQQVTNPTNQKSNQAIRVLIQVPVLSQKPELYNGCEVTSTTMLLQWAGVNVTKLQAADILEKDPTPVQKDTNGTITYWGNPNTGFVGDITGANIGYAVYHGPIVDLINYYLPGKAVDLTGSSFDQILAYVSSGKPVVVWNTSFFNKTNNWVTWQSPIGSVNATFDEHCVLLVGYDISKNVVYINDPLDGTQAKAVPMDGFEQAWEQLGSQAVSIH
jgi:uncharacterized protein YvpB